MKLFMLIKHQLQAKSHEKVIIVICMANGFFFSLGKNSYYPFNDGQSTIVHLRYLPHIISICKMVNAITEIQERLVYQSLPGKWRNCKSSMAMTY